MATLTIELPDDLVNAVEALGLLEKHALISVFEEAVERQKAMDELLSFADALAALDLPKMSSDEIQAEIVEARKALRAARP